MLQFACYLLFLLTAHSVANTTKLCWSLDHMTQHVRCQLDNVAILMNQPLEFFLESDRDNRCFTESVGQRQIIEKFQNARSKENSLFSVAKSNENKN